MIKIMNEVDFSGFDNDDFGERWVEYIPKECVKGATLLSREEYENYMDEIISINNCNTISCWWLRSAGFSNEYACGVECDDGSVHPDYDVDDSEPGIRPALFLNLQSSNLDPRDKFEFGEHTFMVISNDLAICDDFIGKGCFRKDWEAEDANDYEKSDVKKVVDNWFNETYRNCEA